MYDMYPDWGPTKNRTTSEATYPGADQHTQEAVQVSLDLRDNGGQRPDDN